MWNATVCLTGAFQIDKKYMIYTRNTQVTKLKTLVQEQHNSGNHVLD